MAGPGKGFITLTGDGNIEGLCDAVQFRHILGGKRAKTTPIEDESLSVATWFGHGLNRTSRYSVG